MEVQGHKPIITHFTTEGLPTVILKKVSGLVDVLNQERIQMKKLKNFLGDGIPDEAARIRQYCWKLILGYLPEQKSKWQQKVDKQQQTYQKFIEIFLPGERYPDHPIQLNRSHQLFDKLEQDFYLWEAIEKDTSRTHAELSFFCTPAPQIMMPFLTSPRREKFRLIFGDSQEDYKNFLKNKQKQRKTYRYDYMTRILYIYAKLNPKIQYVQGMNQILAPIFYLVNAGKPSMSSIQQAACFFMFNNAISDVIELHIKDLDKSENGIYGKLNQVNEMLVVIQPIVWNRLQTLKIDPFFYCFRWMTLLFAQDFPLFDTLRIWESIFSAQNKYIFLINQEQKYQKNWQQLIDQMSRSNLNIDQKHLIATKVIQQRNTFNRIHRQKDCLENYKLHNIIGRGAFGQVRLATKSSTSKEKPTTEEIVAIKRLEKKKLAHKKQIYNAYLQRNFMVMTKSEYLVQLKSTFQDKDYLYLVMQYVPGGDLLHMLVDKDVLNEEQTRFYIAEIVLAVQQIHKLHYIHRDIKPHNILIDSRGHVKISDFGLSKHLEELQDYSKNPLTKINQLKRHMAVKDRKRCFSKVGTPDYISPEVLTQTTYDFSVDIWGIGVIMFECLLGYPPFSHDDSKQVCHRVVNWLQYLKFPHDSKVSNEAKMLILGMMNNRQQRLTIKRIKMHPFFRNFNWKNVRNQVAPIIPKISHGLDTNNFEKFERQNSWRLQERKTHQQRTRASSADILKFSYPGFEFKRINCNIFEEARKEIKTLIKQKCCEKVIRSRRNLKKTVTKFVPEGKKEKHTPQGTGTMGRDRQNKSRQIDDPLKQETPMLRIMKKKTIQ